MSPRRGSPARCLPSRRAALWSLGQLHALLYGMTLHQGVDRLNGDRSKRATLIIGVERVVVESIAPLIRRHDVPRLSSLHVDVGSIQRIDRRGTLATSTTHFVAKHVVDLDNLIAIAPIDVMIGELRAGPQIDLELH